MALKVGDTYIMPGQEVALEELSAPIEIGTVSNFRVSAEKKKQEMIEKAEAKKKEKEEAKANRSTGAEYVFDPWQKNPCCVCPPCALFGPCIDDMINPDCPGAGMFCLPCNVVCGKLTKPLFVGHCKCCQLCTFCTSCTCSCCPPKCSCCGITCPPCYPDCSCFLKCVPKCIKCCPPKCEWCGITCPPQCCLDCMPKCLKCCPPKCTWCGIQCPMECCLNCKCPPECCLKCLGLKVVGCDCVFCHGTCTVYPKCCPACICCNDETIKVEENMLIVKGKAAATVELTSTAGGPEVEAMTR